MATTSTIVVAEMNSRKKLLCRELESTIKLAIAESSKLDEKPISRFSSNEFNWPYKIGLLTVLCQKFHSEIGQSIFGIIEAMFIHGLRDAFFLRASRHSKLPIPNFWPFISKNTHRSIKQQISELGQIRTEVGKARAWIRIVLAENTLEHYLNLFTKDSQISQFYDKSAFIRDPECIEIFNKSLKAVSQIQICAATNSSLLNNWTPTPLILAGLIQGNIMPKVPSNLPPKNEFEIDEFAGVENEPEMGINAMDLLEEKQTLNSSASSGQADLLLPFSPQSTSRQIDEISSECSEEIDENESVLSHPSILEEFNNFYASGPSNKFRQQQQFMPTILGILPDENIVEDEQKVDGPKVEYSSEVIVHRRKIGRRRAVSRSSCGSEGNSSGIMNLPKNQANNEQISENIADEKPKASEIIEIEQQNKDDANAKEIPLGMSLQEELLLAEKPQICGSVPRITSDPQLNEPIGQRRMAEFTICSTDSSTNDLPQTFDEALREFLQRENSQEEIKKEKEMEEKQHNDGQSNNSAASSSANLEHSSSTESSAENLQIETNKETLKMDESMVKTTTICLISPSRELAQIPFERDENASKSKEDENQMVEIFPFGQKLDGDTILDQQLATNEQQPSYSMPRRLLFLTKLPMEIGLDSQNFRCKSCRRNIGVGFGPFKICALTGHYHCDLCMGKNHHHESLIPAKALLNGDFQKRAVSSQSWALLRSIASQPLFRVDYLNPQIYKFHKQLRKIKDLRKKLGLLVMYLLSCKNSIADDIKRRLWPHNHLHTDAHLYSISDLEGVADGSLERRLNAMCTFANDHIQNCALCIQKGFFCELCSSERPIYPFQIETTYQCAQCSSCFHRECASKFGLIEDKIFANRENHQKISSTSTNSSLNPPNCPKCLRRVKYSSAALNSLATTSTIINTN